MSAALEPYPHVDLSIKHRLGVADAANYDAEYDRQQDDSATLSSCLTFVRAVTLNGSVKEMHVHGRIALLGDVESTGAKSSASLWVPGESQEEKESKVDHKRLQYHAKRKSRLATIMNRSVPPLRPNVVNELAKAVPGIEFVTNGGIDTMQDVRDRLTSRMPTVVWCHLRRTCRNQIIPVPFPRLILYGVTRFSIFLLGSKCWRPLRNTALKRKIG
jgi:tRNA-dihydrouridine synthase